MPDEEEDVLEVLPDELEDWLVPLDDDAAAELEAPDDAEEPDEPDDPDDPDALEAAPGVKLLLPAPNPIVGAKVPPTTTGSLANFAVMTRLPLPLSDALTCALPGRLVLSALMRFPTVSLPVEE